MGEYKDGDVSLTVSWEPGEGFLVGTYVAANAGEARILLFDRMYHTATSGKRTVDPDHSWRWLEDGGSYRVAKFVPAIPPGTKVESPELPYARLLEPNATLQGRVVLPVPLDQMMAYEVAPPLEPVDAIASITLAIGFAPVDDQVQANKIGEGDDLAYSLPYSWASPRQKIVATEPFEIALPMRKP